MSNNKNGKATKDYLSKKGILALIIMMWVGVALCLFSWFIKFDIFGVSSEVLGLPGGVLAIAGVILILFVPKCPYCGKHKIGRNIGAQIKKEVECPDCNKTVEIK